MTYIRSIIKGMVIALAVFLIVGITYRIGRHSFELTNEVMLINKPATIVWQDTKVLPQGHGLAILTPLVSSIKIVNESPPEGITPDVVHVTGDQIQFVDLESNNLIPIESELVSRKIINRFGTPICSWSCSVSGQLDVTNNQYFLSANTSGGGDAGFSVTFNIQHCSNQEFELVIVERLWEDKTRKCNIRFHINNDGTITTKPNNKSG